LPLYLKTKFRLSENSKLYVMGGGVASFSPTAHQHIKQTYEGEYLKTKWSLYEPKIRILDEESSNVYMIQRWNVGLAAEAGVEVNDRMTVGVGFKHVLNNMSAIRYMGTIIQPETRMWIASLSVGYFF
jgi:opacity protein-like surface antigen